MEAHHLVAGFSSGRITPCAPKSRSGTLAKFWAKVCPVISAKEKAELKKREAWQGVDLEA